MHTQQIHIYGAQSCSADTASSRYLPIYALSHAQPTLQKAPMNDLNNPVLLLFCHLVITGKTQPAPENIGSNVDSRALYVSICTASAIALNRNKRVCPIYRLHMHGLPHYACYIDNLSPCHNKRIISWILLFSAHFRCNLGSPSKLNRVPQCYPCDVCFFSFSRSA